MAMDGKMTPMYQHQPACERQQKQKDDAHQRAIQPSHTSD
jgi:hypothetical protein